jgi:hypothetical protein
VGAGLRKAQVVELAMAVVGLHPRIQRYSLLGKKIWVVEI